MESKLALATPQPGEWQMMKEQAAMLVGTGFLPESIKKPEQAVAIMLKGRELGLPPMQALNSITVIKGKPTCSAELLQALIYRDHGDNALRFVETTAERATLEYRRRSWAKPERFSFTIEDAAKANLMANGTWKQYPAAMLRARCISAVARMAFADSIGGMYTPEELGAQVAVDGEGGLTVVEVVTPRPLSGSGAEVVDLVTGEIVDDEPDPRELDFLDRIEAARTIGDLALIADDIKKTGLGDESRKALLGAYNRRKIALNRKAAPVEPQTALLEDEADPDRFTA